MPSNFNCSSWDARDKIHSLNNQRNKQLISKKTHNGKVISLKKNKPLVHLRPLLRLMSERESGLSEYENISVTVDNDNNIRKRHKFDSDIQRTNYHLLRSITNDFCVKPQVSLPESNFYRVTIPFGQKYSKEFVLESLLKQISPDTFTPIMYRENELNSSFFVDNIAIASKLRDCNRKISTKTGFTLKILVKRGAPACIIDLDFQVELERALERRYKAVTNTLDLSEFHLDPDLANEYFCPLLKPVIMSTVLNMSIRKIPHVETINFEGNKLRLIKSLGIFIKKFKNLKNLYIGDNQLSEFSQLDPLDGLDLKELRLEGNPLYQRYKYNNDEYVSDLRRRFPKLVRLDGVNLLPPISFDLLDKDFELPKSKKIFAADTNAQIIANNFLKEYFDIFDSENRLPLLNAYHDDAIFSITVSPTINYLRTSCYLTEDRNLYLSYDSRERRNLLRLGRSSIVSFILKIPPTKHDFKSFTMDISLTTETMMLITVTGLFKEMNNENSVIRCFNRTFLIVPVGSGYCICNEQFHIENPTEEQEETFNLETIVSQTSSSIVESSDDLLNSVNMNLEKVKGDMTLRLSEETNMNVEWSLKCLMDVEWNFDKALVAFKEFHELGLVPIEAFKK